MNEQLRELSLDDLSCVGGGETTVEVGTSGGFWTDLARTVSSWISTAEVSQPALNADIGTRG